MHSPAFNDVKTPLVAGVGSAVAVSGFSVSSSGGLSHEGSGLLQFASALDRTQSVPRCTHADPIPLCRTFTFVSQTTTAGPLKRLQCTSAGSSVRVQISAAALLQKVRVDDTSPSSICTGR